VQKYKQTSNYFRGLQPRTQEASTTSTLQMVFTETTFLCHVEHCNVLDAGRMTTQLGTPRGRYDEYSSKFPLSKKPRFNRPVGKSQTPEGDAC
jgi:hypothetical protein